MKSFVIDTNIILMLDLISLAMITVVVVVVLVVVVVVVDAAAAPPALFAPPGSANQSPVRGHRHLTTRRHLGESRSQPHLRGPPGVVPSWQA